MFRRFSFSLSCSLGLVLLSALPALAQEPPPEGAPAPAAPAEPPPAPAVTPRPAAPRVDAIAEARAARAAGDHGAAAHAFEAAYAAKCDPMLLHDVAAQLEDADDIAGALAYYTRFLAEARTAPTGLRQSLGPHTAELSLEVKRRRLAGPPVRTVACGDEVPLEARYSGPRPKPHAGTQAVAAADARSEASDGDDDEREEAAEDPKAGALVELELEPGSSWRGGFLFGGSFGTLALGIGLEAYELPLPVSVDPTTAPTAVLVTAGARVRMAESEDGKLECLAAFDLGLGTTFGGAVPDGASVSTLLINWRLGPVLRYWVHPRLALALRVGLGAEHVRLSATLAEGAGNGDRTYSDIATFGALQVIGRF